MRFAFLLYPGVEPIDLAAIGVVSMARRVMPELSYCTVAASLAPSRFSNGLRVLPDHDYASCPAVDALIVPGGPGWAEAAQDAQLLAFLRERAPSTLLVSICTGAMLLAAAGLLQGRQATTKCEVTGSEVSPLSLLRRDHAGVDAVHALLVDSGSVITGGGVGLCIDTLLHVLRTRVNAERTEEAVRILEYGAAEKANRARLPVVAL
jgi:transcriptional regulator GlxA family with amidase domain